MPFTVRKVFGCTDDVFIRFWSGGLRARVVMFVSQSVPGTVVGTVTTPRFALPRALERFMYSLWGWCAAVAIFQMGRWSQRRQVKCPDQVHVDGRVGTGHGFHKLSLFGDVRPTAEAGQALSSRELSPEAARAARGRVFSRGRARAARRHAAAAFCSVCQMSSNERRRQARQKSEKASRRCHLTSGS